MTASTTPSPTDENVSPRTEAGRALLAASEQRPYGVDWTVHGALPQAILAIEAEAAAPALDVETLRKVVVRVIGDEQVDCSCGRSVLAYNWTNHRKRKSGRPHRIIHQTLAEQIVAAVARLAQDRSPEPER